MPQVELEDLGGGRFRVNGTLTFATVKHALETSRRLFARESALEIDLGGITSADSAGVALVVEWLSEAKRAGKALTFRNIPEQMLAIARISEVDKLLPRAV